MSLSAAKVISKITKVILTETSTFGALLTVLILAFLLIFTYKYGKTVSTQETTLKKSWVIWNQLIISTHIISWKQMNFIVKYTDGVSHLFEVVFLAFTQFSRLGFWAFFAFRCFVGDARHIACRLFGFGLW